MPIELLVTDNSLTNAIFKSLWIFSITLTASITLMFAAGKVPADIMFLQRLSTSFAISGVDSLVIFFIFSYVFTLSPGFTLSGL